MQGFLILQLVVSEFAFGWKVKTYFPKKNYRRFYVPDSVVFDDYHFRLHRSQYKEATRENCFKYCRESRHF